LLSHRGGVTEKLTFFSDIIMCSFVRVVVVCVAYYNGGGCWLLPVMKRGSSCMFEGGMYWIVIADYPRDEKRKTKEPAPPSCQRQTPSLLL